MVIITYLCSSFGIFDLVLISLLAIGNPGRLKGLRYVNSLNSALWAWALRRSIVWTETKWLIPRLRAHAQPTKRNLSLEYLESPRSKIDGGISCKKYCVETMLWLSKAHIGGWKEKGPVQVLWQEPPNLSKFQTDRLDMTWYCSCVRTLEPQS